LRNLPPVGKFIGLLALAIACVVPQTPHLALGLLGLMLVCCPLLANVGVLYLPRRLLVTIPVVILIVFFQVVFNWVGDDSVVYWSLGPISVTAHELTRSLSLSARVVSMLCLLNVYLAVTPLRETLRAVQALLRPLKKIGLPAGDISMVITIMLRFIPLLMTEAEKIFTAQLSRGSGKGKFRSAFAAILPLFLCALERAEKLAEAMLLRLYKPGG
jgi:energy-coupling factor transport system permease protein